MRDDDKFYGQLLIAIIVVVCIVMPGLALLGANFTERPSCNDPGAYCDFYHR
jgi:hypothetical protein